MSLTCSCQSLLAAARSAWAPMSPLSPSSEPGPSQKSCPSPWTTSPGGRICESGCFSSSAQRWPPKTCSEVLAHSDWVFNQIRCTLHTSPKLASKSVIWTHVTMILEIHFTGKLELYQDLRSHQKKGATNVKLAMPPRHTLKPFCIIHLSSTRLTTLLCNEIKFWVFFFY